jgi:hypothetical protein
MDKFDCMGSGNRDFSRETQTRKQAVMNPVFPTRRGLQGDSGDGRWMTSILTILVLDENIISLLYWLGK